MTMPKSVNSQHLLDFHQVKEGLKYTNMRNPSSCDPRSGSAQHP